MPRSAPGFIRVATAHAGGFVLAAALAGQAAGTPRASSPPRRTLRAGYVLATASHPRAIAVGDLDGDRRADLVVASYLGHRVEWFRAPLRPDSTAAGGFDADSSPSCLAVADLDGDGALDVVTASDLDSRIRIHFGDGHGGFPAVRVLDAATPVTALATADIDRDGAQDLLVARAAGPVLLIYGDGKRAFARDAEIGAPAAALAVAHLADQGPTLIVADADDDAVALFPLAPPGPAAARVATPAGPVALAVLAPDGGAPTLAVACAVADSLAFFRLPPGASLAPLRTLEVPGRPSSLATATVAGASATLAVACSGSGEVALVSADRVSRLPARSRPASLVLHDLDGDGRLDLAVIETGLDGITIYPGSPDGGLESAEAVPVAPSLALFAAVPACAGHPAQVIAYDAMHARLLAPGPGGHARLLADQAPAGASLRIGTAVEDPAAGASLVALAGDRAIAWGRDAGGDLCQTAGSEAAADLEAQLLTDIDGDGIPDLVALAAATREMRWWKGVPGGGFLPAGRTSAPPGASWLRAAAGEVVALAPPDLVARYAAGPAGLLPWTAHRLALGSRPPILADLDRDGRPDLVAFGAASSDLLIYYGRERGYEDAARLEGAAGYPEAGVAADLDGDGHVDLAIADSASASVVVWRGAPGRRFVREGAYAVAGRPAALALGDFDGDGAPDLAVLHQTPGAISFLLNRGPRQAGRRP